MASSQEAFAKFYQWKNANTVLNVTVIEEGRVLENFVGRVAGIDAAESSVSFSRGKIHQFTPLMDFDAALFTIEERALSADRPDGYCVRCEEVER
jgi:hypothetical protein